MKRRLVTLAAAASLLLFANALIAHKGFPPTTSPTAADSIHSTVLGVDGKPLARARVLLVRPGENTWISVGAPTKGVRSRYASTETRADGTFTFVRDERDASAYWLVVLTEEGFADLLVTAESDDGADTAEPGEAAKHERASRRHTLQLRRWGRIEGVLRRGNAPLPNETISYARLSSLGNLLVEELPGVYFNDYATTGADGSFTFERVPPGVNQVCLTICTRLAVNHTIHTGVVAIRTRQSRSHLTSVTVEPGATAKVTIGGTGQPVIGKVDAHEPIDWSGVSASLTYSPVPEKGFQNAKGVLESMSAAREYYVTVDADGNFRAEDVPEGRYKLFISISTGTELRVFTTEPEQIEVPPIDGGRSDEPLDVGLIRVEPRD